jgi:hypothetical protein
MSSFSVRPRFRHTLSLDEAAIQERLLRHIQTSGTEFEVKVFPQFICLRIPEGERKFWTPRLTLSLEPGEGGRTVVHGIYGPNAEFWSFYLYSGLIVGSVALFSGILGLCQKSLDMNPWGLWIFGIAVAAGAGLYLVAQIGQKLAAQQTFRLHQAYEAALGTSVEVH